MVMSVLGTLKTRLPEILSVKFAFFTWIVLIPSTYSLFIVLFKF